MRCVRHALVVQAPLEPLTPGGHPKVNRPPPETGLVHRVLPGNYLGQADGRVTEISPSKISVVEIVPDGLGGYMERPASLALN